MRRVSIWEDENVLEMESNDGYTKMWMSLMPLTSALKNRLKGNFMSCVFYCNLKKRSGSIWSVVLNCQIVFILLKKPKGV